MAITTVRYPISVQGQAITNGLDGNLWFAGAGEIGAVNPTNGFVGQVPLITNGTFQGIAAGKDGKLYLTDSHFDGSGAIGVFDPKTFSYAEFPTPTKNSDPFGITVAGDGTIWFTESEADKIASFDPTTHAITEYALSTPNAAPEGLAIGPDGGLWFTEGGVGGVGRFDPSTHANASFAAGTHISPSIVAGPDGKLWFGLPGDVGSIDSTSHAVATFPSGFTFGTPSAFGVGPDGHIYYSGTPDIATQAIGDIDPTTHAVAVSVTPGPAYTFAFGTPTPAYAMGIVTGPDGKLWFADHDYIGAGTVIPADRSAVAGYVMNDDASPAAGQVVFLDVAQTGTLAPGDPTAVTDASGYYTFTDLDPRGYFVRVAYPGNIQTVPADPIVATADAGLLTTVPAIRIASTSAILPLSYFLSPSGTSNPNLPTAEVNGLYNILFGHLPDPTGLANAVAYLNGGGSLKALTTLLMDTTEYETRVVAQDYLNFAGRMGTPSEIGAWVNLMRGGTTPEQIAFLMLTSDGFNAVHADNASFIQALYNDVLGRTGSDSEVAAWNTVLTTGATRTAVVGSFLYSAPALTRAVNGLGVVFCGATPDAATEQYCVSFLATGRLTLEQVASAFAASSQFVARAQSTVG